MASNLLRQLTTGLSLEDLTALSTSLQAHLENATADLRRPLNLAPLAPGETAPLPSVEPSPNHHALAPPLQKEPPTANSTKPNTLAPLTQKEPPTANSTKPNAFAPTTQKEPPTASLTRPNALAPPTHKEPQAANSSKKKGKDTNTASASQKEQPTAEGSNKKGKGTGETRGPLPRGRPRKKADEVGAEG